MLPKQIDRYEIQGDLGRGGMASVYRAYDPRFKREVAIKVLPPELMHDPQFRARFEREAQVIASLEHAAIVPVYDFGEVAETSQPYIVMRLMNGGSLSDRLRNGSLSLKEAADLVGRIAPALDKAHGKGIVHRDLKPGNILFDSDSNPFIADFGIAKLSEGSTNFTSSGGIVGTPAYMSPEQARGEHIDGRSDIYALGAIVFEMLTGKLPYEADTPMGLAVKHITDPVPHIHDTKPSLPPACDRLIEKAMAKRASDRYSTATELATALQAIASAPVQQNVGAGAPRTQPIESKTTYLESPVQTPKAQAAPQRNWLWILVGAGVVIFGCLVVGAITTTFMASRLRGQPTHVAELTNTPVAVVVLDTLAPTPTQTLTATATATATPDITSTANAAATELRVLVNTVSAETAVAADAWPVVVTETFSNNANQWVLGPQENGSMKSISSIEDGQFVVNATAKQAFVQPLFLPDQYTDFTASVDVDLSQASDKGEMGLEFRYVQTNDSFYYFSITNGGLYYLGLYRDNTWQDLISYKRSPSISPSGINHITVNVFGERIILQINNKIVDSYVDDVLTKGKLAFAFSLPTGGKGTFRYDNLEIRAP